MKSAGAALLAMVLVLPAASAVEASGMLTLRGESEFPAGARVVAQPCAMLSAGADFTKFVLTARSLVIHHYRLEYRAVVVDHELRAFADWSVKSYVLRDVSLRLAPAPAGYVGFYAGNETRISFIPDKGLQLRAADEGVVTNAAGASGEDSPHFADVYYRQHVDQPHLRGNSTGALKAGGGYVLKIVADDVYVDSSSGNRTFSTGFHQTEKHGLLVGHVSEGHFDFLVVEVAEGGVLEAEGAPDWDLALCRTGIAWEGTARLSPVRGHLETATARFPARGTEETVEGAFEGELSVTDIGGTTLAHLALEGDLDSTSMRQVVIPQPEQKRPVASWLAPLALAASGMGVATLLALRRPGRGGALSAPFTPEDCAARAADAMAARNWKDAEAWLERAHRLCPGSAAICADLAYARRELGNLDEALALLDEARRLRPGDAEVEFQGAVTALMADRPADEVETWLARALDADPAYAALVEEDSTFRALEGRPSFDEALGRAWLAFHARGPDGAA